MNRPKDSNSSLDYASDSVTSRSNSKKVSQSRTTTINQRNRELNNSEPSRLSFHMYLIDSIDVNILVRRQSSSESQSEIEALDNIDASSVNRCKQKTIGDLSNESKLSHLKNENKSPNPTLYFKETSVMQWKICRRLHLISCRKSVINC